MPIKAGARACASRLARYPACKTRFTRAADVAQQASKGPGDGCRDARQTVVADIASEGLRLRSEMQRAAEEERCARFPLFASKPNARCRSTPQAV